MRIVAGAFKGRTLRAPKGAGTRPTTDRVRESLMSAVGSVRGGFDDAVVLDAFAGSGALGFEALSRGAACGCFYEHDGAAWQVVRENAQKLGLDVRQAAIRRANVLACPPLHTRPPFDIVFLDPPYAYDPAEIVGLPARLASAGALARGAFVVYEHAATAMTAVDEAVSRSGLSLVSRKKYGDTVVDILNVVPGGGQEPPELSQEHAGKPAARRKERSS